ncbi:MAG: hypothetical protein ABEJ02_04430 [Candidatus Paceibacteria bacterium]
MNIESHIGNRESRQEEGEEDVEGDIGEVIEPEKEERPSKGCYKVRDK